MHFILQMGGASSKMLFFDCVRAGSTGEGMSALRTHPEAEAQILQRSVVSTTMGHQKFLWYFHGSPEESKEAYCICSWCWPNYYWFQRETEAPIFLI